MCYFHSISISAKNNLKKFALTVLLPFLSETASRSQLNLHYLMVL